MCTFPNKKYLNEDRPLLLSLMQFSMRAVPICLVKSNYQQQEL